MQKRLITDLDESSIALRKKLVRFNIDVIIFCCSCVNSNEICIFCILLTWSIAHTLSPHWPFSLFTSLLHITDGDIKLRILIPYHLVLKRQIFNVPIWLLVKLVLNFLSKMFSLIYKLKLLLASLQR